MLRERRSSAHGGGFIPFCPFAGFAGEREASKIREFGEIREEESASGIIIKVGDVESLETGRVLCEGGNDREGVFDEVANLGSLEKDGSYVWTDLEDAFDNFRRNDPFKSSVEVDELDVGSKVRELFESKDLSIRE